IRKRMPGLNGCHRLGVGIQPPPHPGAVSAQRAMDVCNLQARRHQRCRRILTSDQIANHRPVETKLKALIDNDDELSAVVWKLNSYLATVPVEFVDGLIGYAIRVCPYLRSEATRRAIDTERQAVRESWALADQLDEWRQEEDDHTRYHRHRRRDR
ncbi:MAG TPA: hypothetical protein VE197_19210, partial [Mycobacterium sp.]|nr:hypothetical protein [Mycobacterium sp.]